MSARMPRPRGRAMRAVRPQPRIRLLHLGTGEMSGKEERRQALKPAASPLELPTMRRKIDR